MVFLWFNPVTYYISEDAGVVIMTIERRGANGIPVNVSIITVDLNATGTKAKKKQKKNGGMIRSSLFCALTTQLG